MAASQETCRSPPHSQPGGASGKGAIMSTVSRGQRRHCVRLSAGAVLLPCVVPGAAAQATDYPLDTAEAVAAALNRTGEANPGAG